MPVRKTNICPLSFVVPKFFVDIKLSMCISHESRCEAV